MLSFRDIPIRRKLTLVIIVASCIAFLACTITVVTYELATFRQRSLRELSAQAETLAASAHAALDFDDAKVAQEMLTTLRASSKILSACLYRIDGNLLASYVRPDTATFKFPPPESDGHRFEGRRLSLFRSINKDGKKMASLYFCYDLQPAYVRLSHYIFLVVIVAVALLAVCLFVAAAFRHLISTPILSLARAAQSVTDEKNYHVQAVKHANDEIGQLTDTFNQMLAAIAGRDESLQHANQQLEERGRQLQHELAERRRTQEALAQSEEKWRSLAQNAPDIIITVDPSGTILFINRVLPGFEFNRVVGSSVFEYIPVESHAKVRAALERVFATGETAHYEIRGAGAHQQTAWYSSRVGPIKNGDRIVAATVIASDITQQKQLEEHFRQALKMEAVGRLAGGVAHDFNNLLLAILGFSDVLLSELEPNSPLRESVIEIQNAADRAASLTRQLLAYSRKQVLQLRMLDLNDLVKEVDRLLRRMIGEDIELITQLDSTLGPIQGDPNQLTQVLTNLAINARDAMPEGGTLTLQTEPVELNGGESELPAGRYVLLTVSDTGRGMSAEVKSHLFEPFFTTKDVGKGTGLGLSTVYGTIKQIGGDVRVESDLGRGTRFRIYLPCGNESALAPEPIQSVGSCADARETIR